MTARLGALAVRMRALDDDDGDAAPAAADASTEHASPAPESATRGHVSS
jgi:hypothetical protein